MVNDMMMNDMKKAKRGCRGRAAKKRSREKWLRRIGAAYAHQGRRLLSSEQRSSLLASGSRDARCVKKMMKKNTPTQLAGEGIRSSPDCGDDGAAEAAAGRTVPVGAGEASAGRPEDAGRWDVLAARGGGPQPIARAASTIKEVAEEATKGSCSADVTFAWWLMVGTAVAVVAYVVNTCGESWGPVTVALLLGASIARWGQVEHQSVAMGASTTSTTPGKKRRVSKQQRLQQCWKRVFDILVKQGEAGEVLRLKAVVGELKGRIKSLEAEAIKQDEAFHRRLAEERRDKVQAWHQVAEWQDKVNALLPQLEALQENDRRIRAKLAEEGFRF